MKKVLDQKRGEERKRWENKWWPAEGIICLPSTGTEEAQEKNKLCQFFAQLSFLSASFYFFPTSPSGSQSISRLGSCGGCDRLQTDPMTPLPSCSLEECEGTDWSSYFSSKCLASVAQEEIIRSSPCCGLNLFLNFKAVLKKLETDINEIICQQSLTLSFKKVEAMSSTDSARTDRRSSTTVCLKPLER